MAVLEEAGLALMSSAAQLINAVGAERQRTQVLA